MTNETQISEKKQKKEKVVKEKKPASDKPVSDKVVKAKKPVKEKVVKEKVVKKVAKTKDGPKKNLTSYMWFCNAERKNIKNENKELSSKAVISELAVRWRKLKEGGDVDKLKIYEKMAQDDKERYIKEKENLASKVEVIAEVENENESEVVPTPEPEVVVAEVAQPEDKKVKKTKNKKK